MKRVTPNLTDVVTTKYISNLSRLRRLARYWGTTTVNGVEVFNRKKHFYPNMDDSTEKLTKFLDIYDEVKVDQPGLRSSWLHFNPSKAKDSETNWDATILAENFNAALHKTLTCTVVIGPKIVKKKQVPAGITTSISDQAGIANEIKAKYNNLWNEGHVFFTSENDAYLGLLAMYILRSTDIPYEITQVETTYSSTYLPTSDAMDGVSIADQVPAWRVRISIPDFEFTASTDILGKLINDCTKDRPADRLVKERLSTASTPTNASDGSTGGIEEDTRYEDLPVNTSDFWYTTVEIEGVSIKRTRYLRASILTTPSLNTADKFAYMMSCIDTGYLKKKLKWYEVLAVIFIVVAAGFIAGPTGVALATAGFGPAVTAIVITAITITVAALYISLATLAASYMGAHNVAAALGQFLKTVSPLVQIASVISLIVSVYAIIRRSVEQAALEAARQGTEATLSSVAANVGQVVVESVTGLTKLSNITMLHVLKMLSFTFDIYKDVKTRDLQREISNYRKEIAAISESKEKSETSDIVKDLMASYPNVLSSDWSYYSELYDRPYEWWSTPFHTGNIQATTVNALWLNDPQNAILYNNFTGDS